MSYIKVTSLKKKRKSLQRLLSSKLISCITNKKVRSFTRLRVINFTRLII